MRVKRAIEICKNIKSENIILDDKLEAIQTLLDSQQSSFNLPKNHLFETLGFLKKEFEKFYDDDIMRKRIKRGLGKLPIKIKESYRLDYDIITVSVVFDVGTAKQFILPDNEAVTLQEIKMQQKNCEGTILVVAENPFEGTVFKYGNHGDFWEKIGETCGYA